MYIRLFHFHAHMSCTTLEICTSNWACVVSVTRNPFKTCKCFKITCLLAGCVFEVSFSISEELAFCASKNLHLKFHFHFRVPVVSFNVDGPRHRREVGGTLYRATDVNIDKSSNVSKVSLLKNYNSLLVYKTLPTLHTLSFNITYTLLSCKAYPFLDRFFRNKCGFLVSSVKFSCVGIIKIP